MEKILEVSRHLNVRQFQHIIRSQNHFKTGWPLEHLWSTFMCSGRIFPRELVEFLEQIIAFLFVVSLIWGGGKYGNR